MKNTGYVNFVILFLLAFFLCACGGQHNTPNADMKLDSFEFANTLDTQKRSTYTEITGGKFLSLADFEPRIDETDTDEQLFEVISTSGQFRKNCRTVVTPVMTGSAALEATLAPGDRLQMRPAQLQNMAGYKLLAVALHIDHPRDDLRISITDNHGRSWHSNTMLVKSGWNKVLLDIRPDKLAIKDTNTGTRQADQQSSSIETISVIEIFFAAASETIQLHIDDLMLIDNKRVISGGPDNLLLSRSGLDYKIDFRGRKRLSYTLRAGSDGLFRMDGLQPVLNLYGDIQPPEILQHSGDGLNLLGSRKLSTCEIIENNSLRLRLRSWWYFPPGLGRWRDMNVRNLRWDYCFYNDGRVIVSLLMNNAGGQEILSASALCPQPSWAAGDRSGQAGKKFYYPRLDGQVLRTAWQTRPLSQSNSSYNDSDRGTITILQGRSVELPEYNRPAAAPEPAAIESEPITAANYDFSEGCYCLQMQNGQCRFTLKPTSQPIQRPIIKILRDVTAGTTASPTAPATPATPATLSCNAAAVDEIIITDTAIIAIINERITREALIELHRQ